MSTQLDGIDERLRQLVVATGQLVEGMAELKEITRQQAQTAERQQRNIQQFASIFAEQARAITELSQTAREAVAASRLSAQASQSAAAVAQDNQNAIRDLIDQMRQGR